jgi:transcriptional regulator with XRE-family HTH domain
MTGPITTDFQMFERASPEHRRLIREEQLILEVTEALSEALEREDVTKAELARRLGKSKGFVSQLLAGGRNLTLRTIAGVADALGYDVHVGLVRQVDLDLMWKSPVWLAQDRRASGGPKHARPPALEVAA